MIYEQCRNCQRCQITEEEDKAKFGNIKITRCEPIKAMNKAEYGMFEKGECPHFEIKHVCENCKHLTYFETEIDGKVIEVSDCDRIKDMTKAEIELIDKALCPNFEA